MHHGCQSVVSSPANETGALGLRLMPLLYTTVNTHVSHVTHVPRWVSLDVELTLLTQTLWEVRLIGSGLVVGAVPLRWI